MRGRSSSDLLAAIVLAQICRFYAKNNAADDDVAKIARLKAFTISVERRMRHNENSKFYAAQNWHSANGVGKRAKRDDLPNTSSAVRYDNFSDNRNPLDVAETMKTVATERSAEHTIDSAKRDYDKDEKHETNEAKSNYSDMVDRSHATTVDNATIDEEEGRKKTEEERMLKKEFVKEDSEEVELNPFVRNRFDPAYPVHNLCGPWSSGRQTSELEWSEPASKLFRILASNEDDDSGYNMFLAPGQLYGSTTNVSVAIYIESMSSFRAQTMDFEVDMYLAMGWYDRRLSHNCTHPILITHKFIAERIWTPDLYFLNSKFAYLQEVTTPNFMAIIYPDGLIFKSIRTDVTLSCMMDLQMFPMDDQECPMLIQSYAYVENLVTLNWLEDPPTYPIARNPDLKLNDMMITGTKYERCSGPYEMFRGTGNWSCIRGLIVMKRLVLFHLIQTYIPTGMLVSVSWMTFWLDARASPARISLTITSLLTLTTMSNGARQDLPQVSYIKAMDIWQTFSQALIFLVLLEYSFVSYFFTRRTFNCAHLKRTSRGSSAAVAPKTRTTTKTHSKLFKFWRNHCGKKNQQNTPAKASFQYLNPLNFPQQLGKLSQNNKNNNVGKLRSEQQRRKVRKFHPQRSSILISDHNYRYRQMATSDIGYARGGAINNTRTSRKTWSVSSCHGEAPRRRKISLSGSFSTMNFSDDSAAQLTTADIKRGLMVNSALVVAGYCPTTRLEQSSVAKTPLELDDTVTDESAEDESDFLINNGLLSHDSNNDLARTIRIPDEKTVRFRRVRPHNYFDDDARTNDTAKTSNTLYSHYDSNESNNEDTEAFEEMRIRPCRKCKWRDEQIGRDIDYYSRFAFPTLFTTFTVVYWLYFSVYRRTIAISVP